MYSLEFGVAAGTVAVGTYGTVRAAQEARHSILTYGYRVTDNAEEYWPPHAILQVRIHGPIDAVV